MTCSIAIGERFVAPVVRRFALDFPELSVTMELTNRVVDLISEGFDLAIRTGYLEDSQLISRKIADREIITCASPLYLNTHGVPETIAALDRLNCLVGSSAFWRFRLNGEDISYKPNGHWRANSGLAVVDAAAAGMGICQLPEFYAAELIDDGALMPVLEAIRPSAEPIWAVFPARRHRSPKVTRLVDRLKNSLVF